MQPSVFSFFRFWCFMLFNHRKTLFHQCLDDARREKLCKNLFSTRKRSLAASDTFHMLTHSFKFYEFFSHILKRKVVLTRSFINLYQTERLLLSATLRRKAELVFVLTQEKGLFQRFRLKPRRKSIGSPKNFFTVRIFK